MSIKISLIKEHGLNIQHTSTLVFSFNLQIRLTASPQPSNKKPIGSISSTK